MSVQDEYFWCPEKVGLFPADWVNQCCSSPIEHIAAFEDILDAYQRMARIERVLRSQVDDFGEAINLLELANRIIQDAPVLSELALQARRDRWNGRYPAFMNRHT